MAAEKHYRDPAAGETSRRCGVTPPDRRRPKRAPFSAAAVAREVVAHALLPEFAR